MGAAERIYHAWDAALGRKDLEAALALYAPDATIESPLVRHLLGGAEGICRGHVPPNSGLRSLDQLARDDLDLRDFRDWRHALELRVEGAKVGIPTERTVTPSGDARWQIAR